MTLFVPQLIFFFVYSFAFLCYFLIPTEVFFDSTQHFKFFSPNAFLFYLLCLVCFLLPIKLKLNPKFVLLDPSYNLLLKYFYTSFILSFFGYIAFFLVVYFNFDQIIIFFISGYILPMKQIIAENTIPGVTTAMQFGIPLFILSAILYYRKPQSRFIILPLIIFFFASIRAFIFSERLALIELITPIIVLMFILNKKLFYKSIIVGLFLFVIIWSFELSRSWAASINNSINPIEYLTNRFFMYFSTSINNSFLVFEHFKITHYAQPLLSPFLQFVQDDISYQNDIYFILSNFGNPEFNNLGYFGELYINFGFLAFPFIILISSIVLLSYKQFINEKFIGMITFPILMISIIDIRIAYLLNIRIFYAYIFFTILVLHSILINRKTDG